MCTQKYASHVLYLKGVSKRMLKTELIKLRCSKNEKMLLLEMSEMISEERQEKISYSEVVRIALIEYAEKNYGTEFVTRYIEDAKPV